MGIYHSSLSATGAYHRSLSAIGPYHSSYIEGVRRQQDENDLPPGLYEARSNLMSGLGLLRKAGLGGCDSNFLNRQLELTRNAGLDKEGRNLTKLDKKLHQMESLVTDLHKEQGNAANVRLYLRSRQCSTLAGLMAMEARGASAGDQARALEKEKAQFAAMDASVKQHQEAIKSGKQSPFPQEPGNHGLTNSRCRIEKMLKVSLGVCQRDRVPMRSRPSSDRGKHHDVARGPAKLGWDRLA